MRSEPTHLDLGPAGEAAHVRAFLAFFRATAADKLRSLAPQAQRAPAAPSGWSPLGLVHHLAAMERRWFTWGFRGEPVADPWRDSAGEPDAPWAVPDGLAAEDVLALLAEQAVRTEEVLATAGLDDLAALGGRFSEEPPTLRWICFHVLQEYARHLGHLDVAVEVAGGHVGE